MTVERDRGEGHRVAIQAGGFQPRVGQLARLRGKADFGFMESGEKLPEDRVILVPVSQSAGRIPTGRNISASHWLRPDGGHPCTGFPTYSVGTQIPQSGTESCATAGRR
ncbi:MAG TPA: hypothetical protein VGS20_09690 [Candidatus Acidoferrales bacterium]|nr:hypothetical protein [Candidatus Acidoferrales bacterium]